MPATQTDTQQKRHDTLLKLLQRHLPDNTRELVEETNLPAYAAVATSPGGDFVSLHPNGQEALDYFASDDSDFEPSYIVHLDTGERREIVTEIKYSIADAAGTKV